VRFKHIFFFNREERCRRARRERPVRDTPSIGTPGVSVEREEKTKNSPTNEKSQPYTSLVY
jgi:hypothetical protein